MDLTTTFLGKTLPNPFVAGASPQSDDVALAVDLQNAGASALVMHSLFEEQIARANTEEVQPVHDSQQAHLFDMAESYFPGEPMFTLRPETYATHLKRLKKELTIPVIGSLNGTTPSGWVDYARRIEDAGADALELNVYSVPVQAEQDAVHVEAQVLATTAAVCSVVRIPVAVKLSPFYSALPNLVSALRGAGAKAVVLFNRSYYPEFNLTDLSVIPQPDLSGSYELPLRLRWLGILHGRANVELAVTGGVHTSEDALRALLAGADTIQLVSVLLRRGPGYLKEVCAGVRHWMNEKKFASVDDFRGLLSLKNCPNPQSYERGTYALGLQSWNARRATILPQVPLG
jgi:dihydroorotate dehydrogenase (fumarate)